MAGPSSALAIAYTVHAKFEDPQLVEPWLAWLRGGHIAQVLSGGAVEATIVQIDSDPPGRLFEIRYLFPSRDAFERYERDHALRLRAEGQARFPQGISYQRSTGIVSDRLRP